MEWAEIPTYGFQPNFFANQASSSLEETLSAKRPDELKEAEPAENINFLLLTFWSHLGTLEPL